MKSQLSKLLVIVLVVLTFATVGSTTFLEEYFYRTRPRTADPVTGRIYIQDVKSARGVAQVYLTRSEKLPFDYVRYMSPILCVAGFITAVILVWQKRRRHTPSKTS
jgi:hypothetical protein